MDIVIIFYNDKYNRRVEFSCIAREFKNKAIILLEELANFHELSYTYKNKTESLDYYNLEDIKL